MKTKEMESVFSQALDWAMYAPNCWIIWTTTDQQGWYERLAPHMDVDDRVFIFEINLKGAQGWMEKWLWEWLTKPRVTGLPAEWGR